MLKETILIFFITTLCCLFPKFIDAKTDKYRCTLKNDPSTSIVIAWNQINGNSPLLYFDTIPFNLNSDSIVVSVKPNKNHWYKRMNNHFVYLNDLTPNTTYYFIIKDSNSISKQMSFTTLPNDNSGISIIAGGDSRNNRSIRKNSNRMVAKLRPDFVLFGGDMTGSDNSNSWKKWFDDWQLTIGEDGHIIPIVVARGNHEKNNSVITKLFDVSNPEVYYAITIGNQLIRAYTLNSLIAPGGKQRDWLENDLESHNNVRWKIAQYHHPMRPHTFRKSEKPSQQKYWAPLFQEYEMDLVVECDAHVVKTTYPIRPSKEKGSDEGFIRDDENGTIYIGEGCWGAPIRKNNDDKNWTRASGSFNQFKWIFVDFDKIEIRTVKTHNPDEIPQLSKENRFTIPVELNIWKPETGDVVTIGRSTPFDNEEMGYLKEEEVLTTSLQNVALAKSISYDWNKFAVVSFFIGLILIMLCPFYFNFKEIKLFQKKNKQL